MKEGSLVETGKFAVVTILVFLIVTVAAILLQPIEAAKSVDLQSDIVRSITSQQNVPSPRTAQGSPVFRFADGSAVVFLEYPVSPIQISCAVQINSSNVVQSVRIVAPLLPPASLRLESIVARAASLSAAGPVGVYSPEERADYVAVLGLIKRAGDLAKKAGAS